MKISSEPAIIQYYKIMINKSLIFKFIDVINIAKSPIPPIMLRRFTRLLTGKTPQSSFVIYFPAFPLSSNLSEQSLTVVLH